MLEYNSSGYGKAKNEIILYPQIKEYMLKKYGNVDCQYKLVPRAIKDESKCIIDFHSINGEKHILLEVKNWSLTQKTILQIIRYLIQAEIRFGDNFELILALGEDNYPYRKKLLEKLGVKLVHTSLFLQ